MLIYVVAMIRAGEIIIIIKQQSDDCNLPLYIEILKKKNCHNKKFNCCNGGAKCLL